MQEVVGRFRPLARLFIRATITRALDGKVQRFGNAGIGGVAGCPFDNLPAEIVWRRAKRSEHRILSRRGGSLRVRQKIWIRFTG